MVSDLYHRMNPLSSLGYEGHLFQSGTGKRVGKNAIIYTNGFASLPACFHRMK